MAGGRPTKYRPEYCEKIIKAMSKGLSKAAASAECGFSHDSLYRWEKKYPEFSDAIKEGEHQCMLFWEKAGIQGMMGKIKGFNATSWIFNMKNRAHWQDRVEHSLDDESPPLQINFSVREPVNDIQVTRGSKS